MTAPVRTARTAPSAGTSSTHRTVNEVMVLEARGSSRKSTRRAATGRSSPWSARRLCVFRPIPGTTHVRRPRAYAFRVEVACRWHAASTQKRELLGDADRLLVDDLVEVLGQAVADSTVGERPLGHALGDARDEHLAGVRVVPAVPQGDEAHHLANDLP